MRLPTSSLLLLVLGSIFPYGINAEENVYDAGDPSVSDSDALAVLCHLLDNQLGWLGN